MSTEYVSFSSRFLTPDRRLFPNRRLLIPAPCLRSPVSYRLPSLPQRIVHDPLHGPLERQIGPHERRRKASVGRQARIGVDLQNPRLPARIDTEIDAGISRQIEQSPTFHRQSTQPIKQRRIGVIEVELTRRAG